MLDLCATSRLRRVRRLATAALTALLTAMAVGAPQTVQAFTVLQVDLADLVRTADVVAHGVIQRTVVLDRRREGRGIWTEFTLRITEVWKGDAKKIGPSFSWRHVGGTAADGTTISVPGMPGFVTGEEVVVVLERTSEGHVVSAGPQGKFMVRTDKQGRKTVTRDLMDVYLMRRDAKTGQVAEAPKTVQVTRPLKDFRAEVLGYVAAQAKPVAPRPTVPGQPPAPGPLGK